MHLNLLSLMFVVLLAGQPSTSSKDHQTSSKDLQQQKLPELCLVRKQRSA